MAVGLSHCARLGSARVALSQDRKGAAICALGVARPTEQSARTRAGHGNGNRPGEAAATPGHVRRGAFLALCVVVGAEQPRQGGERPTGHGAAGRRAVDDPVEHGRAGVCAARRPARGVAHLGASRGHGAGEGEGEGPRGRQPEPVGRALGGAYERVARARHRWRRAACARGGEAAGGAVGVRGWRQTRDGREHRALERARRGTFDVINCALRLLWVCPRSLVLTSGFFSSSKMGRLLVLFLGSGLDHLKLRLIGVYCRSGWSSM